jgi:hypothetical protein
LRATPLSKSVIYCPFVEGVVAVDDLVMTQVSIGNDSEESRATILTSVL